MTPFPRHARLRSFTGARIDRDHAGRARRERIDLRLRKLVFRRALGLAVDFATRRTVSARFTAMARAGRLSFLFFCRCLRMPILSPLPEGREQRLERVRRRENTQMSSL